LILMFDSLMTAVPLALGCFLVAIKEIFSPAWEAKDRVPKKHLGRRL
jgi:hypothetical protein